MRHSFLFNKHILATPEDVVKDAEDDDPEYNYLEEAEQEYDKEDFRDDRAVKIPSKYVLFFSLFLWVFILIKVCDKSILCVIYIIVPDKRGF